MFIITDFPLALVVSPALPQAPDEYQRQYQDQLNNVFRLYFNRLESTLVGVDTEGDIIPPTTVYIVATLPSAVTSGKSARAFVSDATVTTFATVVIGGGANNVPVYSDGTNWRIG